MYRAVITSVGPTANRSVYQLRAKLAEQFANSPLCQSVVVQRDPVILDKSFLSINNPKLSVSDTLEVGSPVGLKNLFVILQNDVPGMYFKGSDSVSIIGSIFKKDEFKNVISGDRTQRTDSRISLFRYGHLLANDDSNFDCIPMGNAEKVYGHVYPIASQFLPARFREISPQHLALAVRLNYETCEFAPTKDGVEELDFVDCMKIIGLDERI